MGIKSADKLMMILLIIRRINNTYFDVTTFYVLKWAGLPGELTVTSQCSAGTHFLDFLKLINFSCPTLIIDYFVINIKILQVESFSWFTEIWDGNKFCNTHFLLLLLLSSSSSPPAPHLKLCVCGGGGAYWRWWRGWVESGGPHMGETPTSWRRSHTPPSPPTHTHTHTGTELTGWIETVCVCVCILFFIKVNKLNHVKQFVIWQQNANCANCANHAALGDTDRHRWHWQTQVRLTDTQVTLTDTGDPDRHRWDWQTQVTLTDTQVTLTDIGETDRHTGDTDRHRWD